MSRPEGAPRACGGPAGTAGRALGRVGEAAALEALRSRGYRIVACNVRLRRGELDIVAVERGTVVFVEVKARRSAAHGTPAEAVTARKRRALVRLAAAYLARRGWSDRPCRFDVAEVWLTPGGGVARVDLIRDDFQA